MISEKINYKEHFNITTGNMLKFFTRTQVVIENKETILYNAYQYFDNFNSKEITNVFRFSSIVELSPDLIISRSSSNFHPIQSPWYRLSNFYKENISFEVLLVSKSNSGYEVLYDGIKGFLPNHYFKNKLLKSSYFDYSSCTISCKCISLSSFFNFFII